MLCIHSILRAKSDPSSLTECSNSLKFSSLPASGFVAQLVIALVVDISWDLLNFDRHWMLERISIDQRVGYEPTQTGYGSSEFEYEPTK